MHAPDGLRKKYCLVFIVFPNCFYLSWVLVYRLEFIRLPRQSGASRIVPAYVS